MFHDSIGGLVLSPMRSWWPTIALPVVLLVQLRQLRSSPAGKAVPSDC